MFRSLRRWKSASLRAGPNRRMLSTARGTAVGSGRSKVALLGAAAASTMGVALAVSALKSPAKADSAKPASPAPATPPPLASDGYQPETATVRRLKTTREIKERFDSFASKELEGQKIMTVEDFCRSLSLDPNNPNSRALFGSADEHHDGTVSLAEYASFVSMLHSSDAEMKVAFALFDLNSDGVVTLDEFEKVVNSRIAGPDFAFSVNQNFVRKYFGADGKKTLNWREFKGVLNNLEREVLRATFARYDPRNIGRIPLQRVLQYLDTQYAAQVVPRHVRENLIARSKEVGSEVTFEQFWALHAFLRDIDTIEATLQKVIAKHNGRDVITREEFQRAFRQSAGPRLLAAQQTVVDTSTAVAAGASAVAGGATAALAVDSTGAVVDDEHVADDPYEVDMIFRIFGKPDGTLDHRHFATWVKSGKVGELPKMTLLESFGLSGLSAMVGATTVFPMDKIKTRLQTSNVPGATIFSMAREIVQKEGFFRLYRGLQAQLAGITPEKALKLTSNQFFVDTLKGNTNRELSFLENALAGIMTGCVQISLTNPVEIVKIRLQMQRLGAEVKSPFTVIRELGLRGLYTGLPATALRDLPFNALYFSIYPFLKTKFKDKNGELDSFRVLGASMLAGMFAAGLDTPADTIKTRLQAGQTKYKGIADCIRTTYREEGWHAFTKGLAPRILIISPLFGITFAVFEKLQHWLLPMKRVPLANIEADFNAIRRSRVQQIDAQLALKYGIKSNGNGSAPQPPAKSA